MDTTIPPASIAQQAVPQPVAPAVQQAAQPIAEPVVQPWPSLGYQGPQPHEDAFAGPPIAHNEPLLSYGSAGEAVRRLVTLLAAVGPQYANNTVIRGESPADVFDNSVMADVRRFQVDYGVSEDLDAWQGHPIPAVDLVEHYIGANTWHALHTLTDR